MSPPRVAGTMEVATAIAEPELDPPGVRSVFHGFRGVPQGNSMVSAIANSIMFNFPMITAPDSLNLDTTVASSAVILFLNIKEPPVVALPATSICSFIPTGSPCSALLKTPL